MRKMTLGKLEIIEAAAASFMEQGYYATSIDDVARRLGATKGRIYHYYASKIDLFFDVHREGMRLLFDAVEPASKLPGSGVEVLEAMLRAHTLAVLEHHTFESVVAQGVHMHRFGATTPSERATLDEQIASRDRFEMMFKRQMNIAKKDGSIGPVDTSIAVKTLLGGIQWSLIWYRPEAEASPKSRSALADKMVAVLIDGVRVRKDGKTGGSRR
jgi:AcrR family transcriptional regulator